MIIGVPKEIKNNENRVGMTPSGVAELVKRGHTIYIQHTAGENSGFQDEAYTAVGAQILPTMEETYAMAFNRGNRVKHSSGFFHPKRIFTEKLTSGYCSICLSNVSTLSGWGSMPDPHCRFANIGKGQPRLMSISR